MVRVSGEELGAASVLVRVEVRKAPVEVTYDGRPELVVLSVDDYALLRQNRKIALTADQMSTEKLRRIASSRMDPAHTDLDALIDQ